MSTGRRPKVLPEAILIEVVVGEGSGLVADADEDSVVRWLALRHLREFLLDQMTSLPARDRRPILLKVRGPITRDQAEKLAAGESIA